VPDRLAERGYTDQLCVDFSPVVVKLMAERHAAIEGIEWREVDVRHMDSIPSESIDVAFDKGTMDAMIHGSPWSPPDDVLENTGQYMREVPNAPPSRFPFKFDDLTQDIELQLLILVFPLSGLARAETGRHVPLHHLSTATLRPAPDRVRGRQLGYQGRCAGRGGVVWLPRVYPVETMRPGTKGATPPKAHGTARRTRKVLNDFFVTEPLDNAALLSCSPPPSSRSSPITSPWPSSLSRNRPTAHSPALL
jgi:hypothetical protein